MIERNLTLFAHTFFLFFSISHSLSAATPKNGTILFIRTAGPSFEEVARNIAATDESLESSNPESIEVLKTRTELSTLAAEPAQLSSPADLLTQLQAKLEQAVICEEYEEAAKLRDEIELLVNRTKT